MKAGADFSSPVWKETILASDANISEVFSRMHLGRSKSNRLEIIDVFQGSFEPGDAGDSFLHHMHMSCIANETQ